MVVGECGSSPVRKQSGGEQRLGHPGPSAGASGLIDAFDRRGNRGSAGPGPPRLPAPCPDSQLTSPQAHGLAWCGQLWRGQQGAFVCVFFLVLFLKPRTQVTWGTFHKKCSSDPIGKSKHLATRDPVLGGGRRLAGRPLQLRGGEPLGASAWVWGCGVCRV